MRRSFSLSVAESIPGEAVALRSRGGSAPVPSSAVPRHNAPRHSAMERKAKPRKVSPARPKSHCLIPFSGRLHAFADEGFLDHIFARLGIRALAQAEAFQHFHHILV